MLDRAASFDDMRARIGASVGKALELLPAEHRPAVTDALANKLMGIAYRYECEHQTQKEHALGTVLIALGVFLGRAQVVKLFAMPEFVDTLCETIRDMRVSLGDFKPASEGIRRC